jgi:hypothetical protein
MSDQGKIKLFKRWVKDWNLFAEEVLNVRLDPQQQEILNAVQTSKMVAVASGTARGKDFVAAVAALCFFYLTPKFDKKTGDLIENTKVAMTAPTGRQVSNIMYPEIVRMYSSAKLKLHGRLVSNDIRTEFAEWFLTGFKADDNATEAWSGFHAVNTMFVVTEASGISEATFAAIEGNLQSNSKILIVFNPNNSIGYAAKAMSSPRWKAYRLDDLTAPNVLEKKKIYAGQVDYEWVKDKVETWCTTITEDDFNEGKGDFDWEGKLYRPNDLFRVKVRGMFPEVSEDVLIPFSWVELANERWQQRKSENLKGVRRIGVDVAGMGRDASVLCHRFNDYVTQFDVHQSDGEADHMKIAGMTFNYLEKAKQATAFIDTIGEGAGVYSRLLEMGCRNAISCKFSESAMNLTDVTEQYEFINMKAYLYWAIRDWLNPAFGSEACLPPVSQLTQELIEVKYLFQSNGKIQIEPKEVTKERLGRSTDYMDALANTFYPYNYKKSGMNIHDLSMLIP